MPSAAGNEIMVILRLNCFLRGIFILDDAKHKASQMKYDLISIWKSKNFRRYGLLAGAALAGYYAYNRYYGRDSHDMKRDAADALRKSRDAANEAIDRGKERTDDAASGIKRGADRLKEKISGATDTTVGKR